MKAKKKYAVDEDLNPTAYTEFGFIHYESGLKDPEVIKLINDSTEPVCFLTGNKGDFRNKLKKDHQLVVVSKKSFKVDDLKSILPKVKTFLETKSGTKKYSFFTLTATQEGRPVLTANPSTKGSRIFDIE